MPSTSEEWNVFFAKAYAKWEAGEGEDYHALAWSAMRLGNKAFAEECKQPAPPDSSFAG